MSLSSRSWFRGLAATSAAVVFAVAGGASALADQITVDGEVLTPITQSGEAMSFGAVPCGVTTTKTARIAVRHVGSQNPQQVFEGGSTRPVTISITTVSGAGLSATLGSGTEITLADGWENTANNTLSDTITATVSITSTVPGGGTGTVNFKGSGVQNDGSDIIDAVGALPVSWTTGSCAPVPTATTTTITCPPGVVFTGAPQMPCSATVSGTGLSQSVTVDYPLDTTNAGSVTVTANYGGDATHQASSDTETFVIHKAPSTTVVTCDPSSVPFTSTAQVPCTAKVTGAGELDRSLSVDYVDNVNAGQATASASYVGDANHDGSTASTKFTIGKATSTVTVTCVPGTYTYTGSAHTPCSASVTGPGLDTTATVSYDDNVNAGTVTASASYAGDANHTGDSSSATFSIGKAKATCDIHGYDGVYDAADHGASGACTGIGDEDAGSLHLGTAFRNVPGGSAHWTFTGNGNYDDQSGDVDITIRKAAATCTITGYDGIYDAAGHGASGACAGIGDENAGTLDLGDGLTNVPGGSAHWTFTGNGNYDDQSGDVDITISKAPSTVSLVCDGAKVFTGSPVTPCSASASRVGVPPLQLEVSYTNNLHAGSATATAGWGGDANHLGDTDSVGFTIAKATSATTVTCPASVYFTGAAQTPCTAVATGVGGLSQSVPVVHTDNILVGTATATATFGGDGDHLGSSDSKTFQIAAWTLKGFYAPVDMGGVWNTVKGGSTVPLKFEVFSGSNELTSTSAITSFTAAKVTCSTGTEDVVENFTTTGATTLRYDSTGGQFIQNWQTPKSAGACYKVTMTSADGSSISALFKLK
jgi:hypothetical protein